MTLKLELFVKNLVSHQSHKTIKHWHNRTTPNYCMNQTMTVLNGNDTVITYQTWQLPLVRKY